MAPISPRKQQPRIDAIFRRRPRPVPTLTPRRRRPAVNPNRIAMDPDVVALLEEAEKAAATRKRKRREVGEKGSIRRAYTRECKLAVLRQWKTGTQKNDAGEEVPVSKYAIAKQHGIHLSLVCRWIQQELRILHQERASRRALQSTASREQEPELEKTLHGISIRSSILTALL